MKELLNSQLIAVVSSSLIPLWKSRLTWIWLRHQPVA